jgi:hypothetical protein
MKTLTELLLDCLKNKVVTAYVKDCIYFYLNAGLPYLILEIVPIDNQIRFSVEP